MRCFYHQDQVAVGSCKACGKGLCPACAVDLEYGLACRGKHEARAEALEQLTVRAMQVQSTAGSAKYVGPAFTGFMGLIFTTYGVFWDRGARLLLFLGIGFLVYSVIVFRVNRRAYARKRADI
jgi:hypothetical protein